LAPIASAGARRRLDENARPRFEVDPAEGRIAAVYSMLNPDKLGHLGPTSTLGLRLVVQRPA
jgi:hypothetical protein